MISGWGEGGLFTTDIADVNMPVFQLGTEFPRFCDIEKSINFLKLSYFMWAVFYQVLVETCPVNIMSVITNNDVEKFHLDIDYFLNDSKSIEEEG